MKKKILSLLLSVAMAFGLWLYVINYISPESEEPYYNIPVIFEGETALAEKGLMITARETTISMKISGNRSDLNKVNNQNITVKVDLSKVYDPGEHELQYSYSFPGDVPTGALTVENKSPETISVTVERKLTKPVDVNVVFTGSAADGYLADTENRVLDVSTINVSGPSSVVELIAGARIDVDLTDRSESISENYRFTLCDAEGNPIDVEQVTTDVAEVHLDVKIQRWKEIELKVNATYGGGATEKNTTIDIQPKTIRVSGSDALLEDLNEIVLDAIDLSTIESNTQKTYTITTPEGVTNISGVTDAVVDIKFKDLSIKKFTVSQIRVINVPEGMEYDLMNEVLEVTLRGPTALINSLTPEDIIVTVDLTGKELGTATMKATVSFLDDRFSAIGEMYSHSVSMTLRLPEEP